MSQLQSYLEALPRGEDSYEEYVQKASVYRKFLDLTPTPGLADALPPSVRRLVTDPVPVSTWVTEVHATAIYLAAYDLGFDSDKAYLEHWKIVNDGLLGGPLYRMLMRAASPKIVLRGMHSRWGNFHKGLRLRLDELSSDVVKARLTYPLGLVPEVISHGYAGALQSALEAGGAKDVRIDVVSYSPTVTIYSGRWR